MQSTYAVDTAAYARSIAAAVSDPELPMLTLEDLGVLRDVVIDAGTVIVSLTPTYSGCPAMATMRDDLVRRLRAEGFADVRVDIVLDPPWSSDWISRRGRETLAQHGISPPGAAPQRDRAITLTLSPTRRDIRCPQCDSARTTKLAEFGPTACKAVYRCAECGEPFEHIKEI